jgi:hypothetical protein
VKTFSLLNFGFLIKSFLKSFKLWSFKWKGKIQLNVTKSRKISLQTGRNSCSEAIFMFMASKGLPRTRPSKASD